MIARNVLIFLCAAGLLALAPLSYAQPIGPLPSFVGTQDSTKTISDEARATSEDANRLANVGNFFEATQRHEDFLGRWEGKPDVVETYTVQMALAAAHLEAAIYRAMNAAKAPDLKDLVRHEQNKGHDQSTHRSGL